MSIQKTKYLPRYTWRDYECWEGAWELIEGVSYAMSPAPSIEHQSVSQKIAFQLSQLLLDCKSCQALLPVDWKVNDETVVQPDNLVICGEVSGAYLTRTPNIIFEVLSPLTAHKDMGIKFDLYQQEGVAYYIIVNPETSVAKVYQLTEDGRLIKKLDASNESYDFKVEGCTLRFKFSEIWDI